MRESESCLQRWLAQADIEDGKRPGVPGAESAALRELRKRNRQLEQQNEILRRAAVYSASREHIPNDLPAGGGPGRGRNIGRGGPAGVGLSRRRSTDAQPVTRRIGGPESPKKL